MSASCLSCLALQSRPAFKPLDGGGLSRLRCATPATAHASRLGTAPHPRNPGSAAPPGSVMLALETPAVMPRCFSPKPRRRPFGGTVFRLKGEAAPKGRTKQERRQHMQDINHPTTNDAGSSPCTPEAHQRSVS